MKNCPPGVKCGGSWTNRMMLTKSSGGGGEPSLGYGLLYNWYAATDARGIAPDGWRVPSPSDFNTLVFFLEDQLGSQDTAIFNQQLKSERNLSDNHPRWNQATSGTNDYSFSAYSAGERGFDSGFYSKFDDNNPQGIFLTTGFLGTAPIYTAIQQNGEELLWNTDQGGFTLGGSIRCVRDTEPPSATLTDADGNIYTWVQIGSQYWLQQSLKTTRYNNGDLIPTGLDNAAWAATTDGAWAYPNGDSNLPI